MDFKTETKKAYNLFPHKFEKKFYEHFLRVLPYADIFLQHLQGKKILDLGSGPGHHARYFQEKGFDVICIDFSERMVHLCKRKGLPSQVMDIENLRLPEESYDGIWAYSSLLHVPKANLPPVVEKIALLLKPCGILGLALHEGQGEDWRIKEDYPGTKRFFSFFSEDEVNALFSPFFEILSKDKTNDEKGHGFLNFLLRKK